MTPHELPPVTVSPGHTIRRPFITAHAPDGTQQEACRLRCDGCGRTKLLFYAGASVPSLEFQTYAASTLLHTTA